MKKGFTPHLLRSKRKITLNHFKKGAGFTLIEILVGLAVLTLAILGIFGAFQTGLTIVGQARTRTAATSLANQRLEMIRNLPYKDIGTIGGIPSGAIVQSEIINRSKIDFTIKTSVAYIDDSFDGLAPEDTLNTDYKRVRVSVTWTGPFFHTPVVLITDVSPKGIETTAGGGTLLIRVFNANAEPVAKANVRIENEKVTPIVSIDTQTDSQGMVLLPGAPAANESYAITVTKEGYSTDQTYTIDPKNPNPIKTHASVFLGQVTKTSFSIDRLSNLTIYSLDDSGTPYWWDENYQYRKQLTVTNNESKIILPVGYPVAYSFNHLSLVENEKSLASGNDVRIVWWNDGEWQELIRTPTTEWNQKKTTVSFALKADIDKADNDDNYYVYYGNPLAGQPPQNAENVYLPPAQTPNPREIAKIDGYTIGYWDFEDGPSSQILTDRADNNHGQLTNLDPANDWVTGKFNYALDFDGKGYVTIPLSKELKNVGNDGKILTIEAWIKKGSAATSTMGIAGIASSVCYKGGYMLSTYFGSIDFAIVPPRTEGCISHRISGGNLELNKWYHVAGTYDGQTMKLYINGVLIAKKEVVTRVSTDMPDPFKIGYLRYGPRGSATQPFTGLIDEVRVSSKARTSDFLIPSINGQIDIIQKKVRGGDNLDFLVADADLDRTKGAANDTARLTVTTDSGEQEDITLYETATEGTFAGVLGTVNGLTAKNNGTLEISNEVITATYLDVEAFDGATNQRRIDIALANDGPLHNLSVDAATIAYWPLNRKNDFVVDYAGNGNLGTTDTERGMVGRFDKAFSFDGSKYVTIPFSDELKTVGNNGRALTIEAWIYPADVSGSKGIAGIGGGGSCNSGGYMLNLKWGSAVFGIVPPSEMGCIRPMVAASGLKLNQWQHLAGTYDGQTMKLYINGVLASQQDIVLQVNPKASPPFTVGHAFNAEGSATEPFKGLIDEVRVSNIARDSFPYAQISLNPSVKEDAEENYHPPGIIPNLALALRGEKLIGTKPNPTPPPDNLPIYKYSKSLATDGQGKLEIKNLEWDTYTLTIDSVKTGYDLAASSPPQPINLFPGASETVRLNLAPHRDNTLLVTVKDARGSAIPGATVRLFNTALHYDKTIIAGANGQSFFSPLAAANYNLEVTKGGYSTYTGIITISGQTNEKIGLNSL